MVILGSQSISSVESGRSLKHKWREIARETSRVSKKPTSPIKPLYFLDEYFLTGEPNEFIPFIISTSILEITVKRVLNDQSISIDIMLQDLLPKLKLSVAEFFPYKGGATSCLGPERIISFEYLEAFVTYGHRKLARTINTTFVVLLLITPHHCIVGRLALARLGAVASAVHLKMNFHSLTGEIVTISADINSTERSQHLTLRGTRHHL